MLANPQSPRLKRLLRWRTVEWVTVRRAYAAGLTVAEIVRELALERETVATYLHEGWKPALRESHLAARHSAYYLDHSRRIDMRPAAR